MRRLLILTTLLTLFLTVPVLAQDDNVALTYPTSVYDVAGVVNIYGTVNPPNLQNYFLETAPYDPSVPENQVRWTPVSLPSKTPVTNGVLAQWQTNIVRDGLYQLRLHVVLQGGGSQLVVVGPIRVGNQLPRPAGLQPTAIAIVPTPIPLAQPTIAPTAVPAPTVFELPIPVGGQIQNFNDTAAALMKNAGMTWVKWQVPFTVGDDLLVNVAADRIKWTHDHGLKVLLSIKGHKEELAAQGGPAYYPAFGDFLARVAQLGPDAIEVWNEQNIDREWPVGQIGGRSYAAMLTAVYPAIKAANPNVMVISGALSPTGFFGGGCSANGCDDAPYLQSMANAGAGQYFDCLGIHYNEGIVPPSASSGDPRGNSSHYTRYYPKMINTYRSIFPNKPLCFTELGYLSPQGLGPLPAGFEWASNVTVAQQAQWLHDAIQIGAEMSSAQIQLIIIWNVDFTNFAQDPQAGYAIIRPDGSCPACEAIATLRTAVAGAG